MGGSPYNDPNPNEELLQHFVRWWNNETSGPFQNNNLRDVKNVRNLMYFLGVGICARNIIEVGVSSGSCSIPLLMTAKQTNGRVISIDPANCEDAKKLVTSCGLDPWWSFKQMRSQDFWKQWDLNHEHGIDLAFVDGDHAYEMVCDDFWNILPRLSEGGIMITHDYGGAKGKLDPPPPEMKNEPGWNSAYRALCTVLPSFPEYFVFPLPWKLNEHTHDVWGEGGSAMVGRSNVGSEGPFFNNGYPVREMPRHKRDNKRDSVFPPPNF